jgi:calreticulin
LIANPDFVDDDTMYAFDDIAFAGFDLWQVRGGTIFDNVVITTSVDEATKIAEATWKPLHEIEEKLKKAADEEAERIRKEEEAKREAEEEDDLDDLDLDDDDL